MNKYVSLVGLPEESNHYNSHLEGGIRAFKQLSPFPLPFIHKNRVWYKELANIPEEENPYTHPEPLGYITHDDPHDPESATYWKWMYLMYVFCALFLLSRGIKTNYAGQSAKDVAENIYHAHYTANLIEDEIRKIREEDFEDRKTYNGLKYGESEESE